jgi:hypothetical protein
MPWSIILDREIDQQDRVLGDDAEQHQEADEHRQRDRLAGDVSAMAAPSGASSSEPMFTNGARKRGRAAPAPRTPAGCRRSPR